MEIQGARTIVAGATGALGSALARALASEGATVGLAGRDPDRLAALSEELDAPSARFEAADPASCERAVDALAAALGGLDIAVVSVGVPAFGDAREIEPAVVEELFRVNALGPMTLVSSAARHIEGDGALVAVTAVVAEQPMAGIAAYSASKAALSAYLTALRRERRRDRVTVLDVRPPHMDTAFSDRALAGTPPELPEPLEHGRMVQATLAAMRAGKRELSWDVRSRELVPA